VLDPSVRLEEPPPGRSLWSGGQAVRRGLLVFNDALMAAALAPPGEGLRELIEDLRQPTPITDLVDEGDIGTADLSWRLIASLLERGFAHRLEDGATPGPEKIRRL